MWVIELFTSNYSNGMDNKLKLHFSVFLLKREVSRLWNVKTNEDCWWRAVRVESQVHLTWDLLGPADHENQLLVCQVGERHHHAGLSEGLLEVLHQVDLWRLRLHDAGDELLWAHGRTMSVVWLREGRAPWQWGKRYPQTEMALGPRTHPDPDQAPPCRLPRLESPSAVSSSSVAAAFAAHTWRIGDRRVKGESKWQNDKSALQIFLVTGKTENIGRFCKTVESLQVAFR